MDIRWILEEAACDCHRMDVEPGNPAFDPGFVINEARKVPATSVVTSNFMEAYCASLRTEIINGVDVRRSHIGITICVHYSCANDRCHFP